MRVMRRMAFGLLGMGMALGVGVGPASADPIFNCNISICAEILEAATGGKCNGYYDADCSYCSYGNSTTASSEFYCDNDYSGYEYVNCTTWVAATCLVG